jgi:hypothetical protein
MLAAFQVVLFRAYTIQLPLWARLLILAFIVAVALTVIYLLIHQSNNKT